MSEKAGKLIKGLPLKQLYHIGREIAKIQKIMNSSYFGRHPLERK